MNHKKFFNLPDNVLVDPALAEDPRIRAGQVGSLTYADIDCDEFYVMLEDEKVRVYHAADLQILKDAHAIYACMEEHKLGLNEYELNAMMSIATMAIYAEDSSYQKEALKLAVQYPSITDVLLISIEDKLNLSRGPKIGR